MKKIIKNQKGVIQLYLPIIAIFVVGVALVIFSKFFIPSPKDLKLEENQKEATSNFDVITDLQKQLNELKQTTTQSPPTIYKETIREVPAVQPITITQPAIQPNAPTTTQPQLESNVANDNSEEIEALSKEINSITNICSKFLDGIKQTVEGLTYSSEGVKYLNSYDYQTASVKFSSGIENIDRAYNIFFNIDKNSTTCCTKLIGETKDNYLQSTNYIKQGLVMYKKWADHEAGANIVDEGKIALSKGLEYKEKGKTDLDMLMKILKDKTAERNALSTP